MRFSMCVRVCVFTLLASYILLCLTFVTTNLTKEGMGSKDPTYKGRASKQLKILCDSQI